MDSSGEQHAGHVALPADSALLAYCRNLPDLLRFLTRQLRCRATAEDVAQETNLRLSQSREKLRNPRPFLFRVAATSPPISVVKSGATPN
jgi:DNA-directed RNA polymerase specialized sigma24 family protein